MALSNRINFRGGQSQPLGKYLYKNGVDNVALTGGLTATGYTFSTGFNTNGVVSFDASNIAMTVPNTSSSSCIFGTTIKVDVTNLNSIVVKFYTTQNVNKTITLDVSAITGEHYMALGVWMAGTTATDPVRIGLMITDTKTNSWSSTSNRTTNADLNNTLSIYIDEIEVA